ncbi:unnamed protein product, partial [Laminaria digitata]
MDSLLPAIDIELPADAEHFSPRALFQSPPDQLWLEIGFGGGEHLAWQAKNNPRAGIIGCEPFINGVVKLLGNI